MRGRRRASHRPLQSPRPLAQRVVRLAVPLAAGALIGLSLPPVGYWPMAIIGVAGLAWALRGQTLRSRLWLGMLTGSAQFLISLAWAIKFNLAGYIVLSLVEGLFIAVACALVPPGRGRLPALAGALTLAEWGRQSWPFGGLPLGGLALGQATGPLAYVARIGGVLLVVGVAGLAGAAVGGFLPWSPATRRVRRAVDSSLERETTARFDPSPTQAAPRNPTSLDVDPPTPPSPSPSPSPRHAAHSLAAATLAAAAAIALTIAGYLAPSGGTPIRRLQVSIVQGGGRRGLDQLQVPVSEVLNAALKETAHVPPGTNLVLWPEDVVALQAPLVGSSTEQVLAGIARRDHATFIAGVTYPVGATVFRNEVVAFGPDGKLDATFEKVHRVPFGEYVPARSFFEHLANLEDIPRDAIPGHGSGEISTPAGKFGVLVSFEVFFTGRGRSGVRAGGQLILVPTNTSSYTDGQAPSQEIAASEFQAIEEGRYVLQAAPTGYSAVISNDGKVASQSGLSVAAVLNANVPLLGGSTWYERFGDTPVLIAALALLAGGWLAAATAFSRASPRRRRRTSPSR